MARIVIELEDGTTADTLEVATNVVDHRREAILLAQGWVVMCDVPAARQKTALPRLHQRVRLRRQLTTGKRVEG